MSASPPSPQPDPALARFAEPTRRWFAAAFDAPTEAQRGTWAALAEGRNTLVVAPTGSGKTLAAFLASLDRLAFGPPPDSAVRRCRVLYVSPLKALGVDVERNLRAPLAGLRQEARRAGLAEPEVLIGLRTGDTPQAERRKFLRKPPDILITTPESLFLMLTSQARESLAGVETVILDEVHAVAGTKRGAHLAVSLERLDELLERPARRIGLSATVRPAEEVARFLGGARPAGVVAPPSGKRFDLRVVVPVPDLTELDRSDPAGRDRQASIWPHVETRIEELITQHTSTLVFANSRRLAERLCNRLNEIHAARLGWVPAVTPHRPPAELMGEAGSVLGAPPVLARAHHGSVSKEQRAQVEEELKAGTLAAVVATSSLELGIDMGAVDLVVQVESPPSVAAGLQRIGRAGHQVGAVSTGVLFPKFRGDLVQAAVVAQRMRSGQIEALRVIRNPLDVLAQQIVAMASMEPWETGRLLAVLRRAAPFHTLAEEVFESVLDMLSGRYPSDEFAELKPRLVWDRATGTVQSRPGAGRLAVNSGGTIPDRGLFGVFLAGAREGNGRPRRVGELDEEMVYESRVGDVFTLGTSSWRIEEITHDRILVSPAPGRPGRLPFWHGDMLGRPVELGRALGAFTREMAGADPAEARERLREIGLDEWAADNLLAYLAEQRAATGRVPDDRTIVVERFRDELGDWRMVLHSPFGAQVNAPWALAIADRLQSVYGFDPQVMHGDDGIVLRLPDAEWGRFEAVEAGGSVDSLGRSDGSDGSGGSGSSSASSAGEQPGLALRTVPQPGLHLVTFAADEIERLVTDAVGGSALFAARFRECAARALLLPRRRPDRRVPLWQQRQRSARLLSVASKFGSFPIVLETLRECLQDVFDLPGLITLLADIEARRVQLVDVETQEPSPFAKSLLFGYVAQFLYEGDSPLAERRAAALSVDPTLLAQLLGQPELRELFDAAAMAELEDDLQRRPRAGSDLRPPTGAEDAADLLRLLGPLTIDELRERGAEPEWLADLAGQRRAFAAEIAGREHWSAVEDAGRLRDALGCELPPDLPAAFAEPVADPLGDLLARYARTHCPFRAAAAAERFGLGAAVVTEVLARLAADGRVVRGAFRPDGGAAEEWCDARVLRRLKARAVAALRRQAEPVAPAALARFLPAWHGIGSAGRRGGGVAGTLRAVEQLAGFPVPASALERVILPARVEDYRPAFLDELTAGGEVVWAGAGALAADDGWVVLAPAEIAPFVLPEPAPVAGLAEPGLLAGLAGPVNLHEALLSLLDDEAAVFFSHLYQSLLEAGPAAASPAAGPTSGPHSEPGADIHRTTLEAGPAAASPAAGPASRPHSGMRSEAGADIHRTPPVDQAAVLAALWDLVWSGRVTNDTFAPVRALLAGGRATHRPATRPAPRGRYAGLRLTVGLRTGIGPGSPAPATATGRWSRLPAAATADGLIGAQILGEVLLDRHGLVTRGSVGAERLGVGFGAVYRILSAFEDAGRCRRGYFAEGLGATQFGAPGTVDRLREFARDGQGHGFGEISEFGAQRETISVTGGPEAVLLAAADPANAYGAALSWPARPADDSAGGPGHRPGRKAGALVILVEGDLVLYLERGGRTVLTWPAAPSALAAAAQEVAAAVRAGRIGTLTVTSIDGAQVLSIEPSGGSPAVVHALTAAGFTLTPQGLRLRST
ncbi:MAG TPA: DEAD/DEAH box helicase [Actinocrinis sp.]|nr:DEAD/DEAH box helicase [Actinocrinis sp.]